MILSVADGRVVHATPRTITAWTRSCSSPSSPWPLPSPAWSGVKALPQSFVFSAYVILEGSRAGLPARPRSGPDLPGRDGRRDGRHPVPGGQGGRTALTAYLGSLLGVGAACALAFLFAGPFNLSGAVVPIRRPCSTPGFPPG